MLICDVWEQKVIGISVIGGLLELDDDVIEDVSVT